MRRLRLIRVEAKNFVGGVIIDDYEVVMTAPILKQLRGFTLAKFRKRIIERKWTVKLIDEWAE